MNTPKGFLLRNALVVTMSLHLVGLGCIPAAHAAVIGTPAFSQSISQSGSQSAVQSVGRDARIQRINGFFARDAVRKQMIGLGVDPKDAQARVAALTDGELQTLDQRIGSMPAGGDVLALFGIVFIVLLILELVGVTHIFSKF